MLMLSPGSRNRKGSHEEDMSQELCLAKIKMPFDAYHHKLAASHIETAGQSINGILHESPVILEYVFPSGNSFAIIINLELITRTTILVELS
jgi:hypothetical protein